MRHFDFDLCTNYWRRKQIYIESLTCASLGMGWDWCDKIDKPTRFDHIHEHDWNKSFFYYEVNFIKGKKTYASGADKKKNLHVIKFDYISFKIILPLLVP
jgi:hypothetical protein